jgi:hypothetical protein
MRKQTASNRTGFGRGAGNGMRSLRRLTLGSALRVDGQKPSPQLLGLLGLARQPSLVLVQAALAHGEPVYSDVLRAPAPVRFHVMAHLNVHSLQ